MCRYFVLRYYSKFMKGKELKRLYCSLVRSVIEFSSVTYGPMLTKYQENQLENLQKRCLRCMFGYQKSYRQLLEESGLQTLKERRETAMLKFAQKTSKNPVYAHWFKENPNPRRNSLRFSKPYVEEMARSERLYNSPLFYFRRLLNGTPNEPPVTTGTEAFVAPLNDPFEF